jgi:hypothetical protein
MSEPTATLRTELTMKRTDYAFLHAAFRHVGWRLEEDLEGITTDDGVDQEVRVTARIKVPLEAVAAAPPLEGLPTEGGLAGLLRDLRLVA